MAEPANSTLVAIAWASAAEGIPANAVGKSLPAPDRWYETGFVVVQTVGGSPHPLIPTARPIVQFDCWAANRNSQKPPFGKAESLAERLRAATYRAVPEIAMPSGFEPVYVEYALARSEPRWIPDPNSSFAHYTIDIELGWISRTPAGGL